MKAKLKNLVKKNLFLDFIFIENKLKKFVENPKKKEKKCFRIIIMNLKIIKINN